MNLQWDGTEASALISDFRSHIRNRTNRCQQARWPLIALQTQTSTSLASPQTRHQSMGATDTVRRPKMTTLKSESKSRKICFKKRSHWRKKMKMAFLNWRDLFARRAP